MHQALTYWQITGIDRFGKQTFAAPRQIGCRWQDVAVLFKDAQGEQRTSSSVVYPKEPLQLKGWIKLGEDATANPVGLTGAYEILQTGQSPNLRGTITLNKVFV